MLLAFCRICQQNKVTNCHEGNIPIVIFLGKQKNTTVKPHEISLFLTETKEKFIALLIHHKIEFYEAATLKQLSTITSILDKAKR